MNRVLIATILSIWLMFLGFITYGIGDYEYALETWIASFSLPIWSIATIGLWYDSGRLLIGSTIDSPNSKSPIWLRSLLFIGWMSIIFTYIFWIHLSIQVIPLLIVIPILAIPLRDWLVRDWSNLKNLIWTNQQLGSIIIWLGSSYMVYWILTMLWILLRVWILDLTTDGYVYFLD